MAPALAVATENPPPLLLAVAGANWRLPAGGNPTLGELGLEVLTVKVRVAEKMELEVTAAGANAEKVRQGLTEVARLLREAYPRWAGAIADVLTRTDGPAETIDGKFRRTIRVQWTAEQWSAFLDLLPL